MSLNKYVGSQVDGVSRRGRVERVTTRVLGNDWGALTPPALGSWTPRLPVSVVLPAHGGQHRLDLALASLAAQTYPDDLIEAVVVDDHSVPALRLPHTRPANTRLVRTPDGGHGAGYARAYGAHTSTGEILLWMDADMIADPRFVEAQARWHHVHPECVTLGRVRFAGHTPDDPDTLSGLLRSGTLHRTLDDGRHHAWVERRLADTDDLREADHLGFHAYVGAAAGLRRGLYEVAGGVDPELDLGQDTEFAYRLWQAGAVMLPERAATAWHTGPGETFRTRLPSERFRTKVLAELMPHPHTYRERVPDDRRRVPLVHAVVDIAGAPYDLVRGCVDRLLDSAETDLLITLVADWESLTAEDRELDELGLGLRLIQANYLREPRIAFASATPRTAFPAPFLLEVPVAWGMGQVALSRLLAGAERSRAGLTELFPATTATTGPGVRLWRTRALARALRVREEGEDVGEVVSALHGRYRIHAGEETLTDLSLYRAVPPLPRRSPESRTENGDRDQDGHDPFDGFGEEGDGGPGGLDHEPPEEEGRAGPDEHGTPPRTPFLRRLGAWIGECWQRIREAHGGGRTDGRDTGGR
ncbi:glycosyltransferase [Nocardiopsis coralli]|uniref:glycosyltransferase n=1 Tax=Nocardiopsis coralli TaxID=2772213 RepID=UPI002E2DF0F3|nr:glycosyltransferase [Nocardiopsis coralli]